MTCWIWSLRSWKERRMPVNTAIPDAASGSQRCSQTRREASTTSNGAASKLIREQYGERATISGPRDERLADDAFGFQRVDVLAGEAELAEELAVVLPEERRVADVPPLRAALEPDGERAVARVADHRVLHFLEEAAVLERR